LVSVNFSSGDKLFKLIPQGDKMEEIGRPGEGRKKNERKEEDGKIYKSYLMYVWYECDCDRRD
jgi:hypothetical protein